MANSSKSSGVSDFLKAMKRGYKRCLDPTMSCEQDAIQAHSVQNATAMGLIEEDGHVVTIRQKIKDGKPKLSFERVGRNQASTFTGLCGKHDTEIFLPIDTRPLSLDNDEQLFLIAYRSVTRELHAVLEGAGRIQGAVNKLIERGELEGETPTPEAAEALQHMLKAWGTWKYRFRNFDEPLAKGRFDGIQHSVITLNHDAPSMAASSFFSAKDKVWGRPFPAAIVNIVPVSATETVVIVSYAREHSGIVRRLVAPIVLEKDAKRRLLLLSQLIVDRMENFYIRPSVVAGWGDAKRDFILDEFFKSIFTGYQTPLDERLALFPDPSAA